MRLFERSQRADRAPVVCTYPRDRSHGQRSCAPCRVYLAIVGHGRTPEVSGFTSAPEAFTAATKRPAAILGLVTNVPTVFSRVVRALILEC
jgi:hypothetical protein